MNISPLHNGTVNLAVDGKKNQRPGEPMEVTPRPAGNAHWTTPAKQPLTPGVLKDSQRDAFTATFGSQHPPAGLSGVIRRAAYEIPDYEVKRWMLLMLADRIDWQESRITRAAKNPLTWVVAGGVLAGATALYVQQRNARRWSINRLIK